MKRRPLKKVSAFIHPWSKGSSVHFEQLPSGDCEKAKVKKGAEFVYILLTFPDRQRSRKIFPLLCRSLLVFKENDQSVCDKSQHIYSPREWGRPERHRRGQRREGEWVPGGLSRAAVEHKRFSFKYKIYAMLKDLSLWIKDSSTHKRTHFYLCGDICNKLPSSLY